MEGRVNNPKELSDASLTGNAVGASGDALLTKDDAGTGGMGGNILLLLLLTREVGGPVGSDDKRSDALLQGDDDGLL